MPDLRSLTIAQLRANLALCNASPNITAPERAEWRAVIVRELAERTALKVLAHRTRRELTRREAKP